MAILAGRRFPALSRRPPGPPQVKGQNMSSASSVADLKHLQDIADAIRQLCHVTEEHGQRSPETQQAAIAALDALADGLPLLNKCRSDFGCYRITPERLARIEEWATLDPAEKAEAYDYFCCAVDLTSPPMHEGGPYNSRSWGEQLDYWMGQLSASPKGARQADALRTAAPTNDAQKLRAVAAALREWGRKAAPSDQDPSTVPDEKREAARQALLLAVKNPDTLDIIDQARTRYGCAEGVVGAGVFDRLSTAAAAHDLGHDLGDYWFWVDFLTGKQLRRGIDVSFPDELDRWASRLEQEPAEVGQVEAEGRNAPAETPEAREPPERLRTAHAAFEQAMEKCPRDMLPKSEKVRYTKAMHEWARENCEGVPDDFNTWTRYVREYERLTGRSKNTPKARRTGRSIVSPGAT